MKTPEPIESVRRFSRFYTATIGTLEESLLNSSLSLTEARLLYEIATAARPTLTTVAARLKLDSGYLSRVIARLGERGLIRRKASAGDARQSVISLTAAGKKTFGMLDSRSNDQVAQLLAPLNSENRRTLSDSMAAIERLLGAPPDTPPKPKPVILRSHRPGDIGWVIHRHGVLYGQEYGWDERFEALVARIAADFVDQYDPGGERCWIAERGQETLGSVFLVKDRTQDATAKLRLLLVEPSARGLGIGRALVRECTAFARSAGYARIILWTNDILTSARHIYETEGYKLIDEEEQEAFGKKHTFQHWELKL